MRTVSLIVMTALGSMLVANTLVAQTDKAMRTAPSPPTPQNQDLKTAVPPAAIFVQKVAMTDMFEIEASKLAMQKSQNKDVNDLAGQMVVEHTEMSNKLKDMIKASNLKLAVPAMLDEAHMKELTTLRGLSGAAFDRAFIEGQVTGHDEAAKLLGVYSKDGDSPVLKQFAIEVVPAVGQHLEHARRIYATMKAPKN